MNKTISRLCILLAGAGWGMTGLFFRHLTAMGFLPMDVVFVKTLFATVIIGIILLATGPKQFVVRWKDLWCFLCAGVISMLLFNFCYFTAMAHTTVAVAVALLYTGPGFVVVISAFLFKEKITARKLIALIVLFIGCACAAGVFTGKQSITALGMCVGVIAGLTYGLYGVFSRLALNRGYAPNTIAFYAMLICVLGSLPFVNFSGLSAVFTAEGFLYSGGISVCSCLLPYLLFTAGMRQTETGEAAMLATTEPIVAALISMIVLSEPVSASVVLGIVLIVGGILFMNIPLGKR